MAADGPAAYFKSRPKGSWLVLRALVPGEGSFVLAINDRLGTGEIVSNDLEDGLAVIGALTDVFTDAGSASHS